MTTFLFIWNEADLAHSVAEAGLELRPLSDGIIDMCYHAPEKAPLNIITLGINFQHEYWR